MPHRHNAVQSRTATEQCGPSLPRYSAVPHCHRIVQSRTAATQRNATWSHTVAKRFSPTLPQSRVATHGNRAVQSRTATKQFVPHSRNTHRPNPQDHRAPQTRPTAALKHPPPTTTPTHHAHEYTSEAPPPPPFSETGLWRLPVARGATTCCPLRPTLAGPSKPSVDGWASPFSRIPLRLCRCLGRANQQPATNHPPSSNAAPAAQAGDACPPGQTPFGGGWA